MISCLKKGVLDYWTIKNMLPNRKREEIYTGCIKSTFYKRKA